MPVPLDSITPDPDYDTRQVMGDITEILYDNPEYAYRAREIGEEIGLPQRTVARILERLCKESLLNKTQDGYYYALEEVDAAEIDREIEDLVSEDD